jgi:uncharacterized protein
MPLHRTSPRAWRAGLAVTAAICLFGLPSVRAEDASPPPAAAVAPDPAAVAAAAELMEAVGASKNFDKMLGMLKQHVVASAGSDTAKAEQATKTFDKLLDKFSGYKKQMMDETAALYATRFTVAEMKTVADFYRSGTGAKFISEMPELMEQAGGIGQKYAVQMMKELREQTQGAPAPEAAPSQK